MCGIVGIFKKNKITSQDILNTKKMADVILHRGPDDSGFYNNENISIGMRRLSIIGVSNGHQPLVTDDESISLVFNGEIYNYIELKELVKDTSYVFKTESDAEVLIPLYQKYGISCLQYLNGMYGFCLWDNIEQKGFLVRDRVGIKPLYYYNDDSNFIFGSELKSILECDLHLNLSHEAIIKYLSFMYIPTPLTPYKEIKKLKPAEYIEFSKTTFEVKNYWNLLKIKETSNLKALKNEFFENLYYSGKIESRSDVPVGISLSGGVDSSLVADMVNKFNPKNMYAFTVNYVGSENSEVDDAKMVTCKYGMKHCVIDVSYKDIIENLKKICWHMDEPSGDSAIFGTYFLSQEASKHVKVIFGGAGGDELFAGYYKHNMTSIKKIVHLLPLFLKKPIHSALCKIDKNKAYAFFRNYTAKDSFLKSSNIFSQETLEGFFTKDCKQININKEAISYFEEYNGSFINKMLYTDIKHYLTDDILLLCDKMSMASSLEMRVPLLDHKIVETAFKIRGEEKIKHREKKYLLKKWLKNILPDKILYNKKMGFGGNVDKWMKDGLKDYTFNILNSRNKTRAHMYWGLFGGKLLEKLNNLSPQQIFNLLMLETWMNVYADKNK